MSDEPKRHDEGPALVTELVEHWEMEEARDYLTRGRCFAGLDDEALNTSWIAAFRDVAAGDHDRTQEMTDLQSELKLRQKSPPYDSVQAEIDALRGNVLLHSPQARSPELDRRISEFLRERMKPRH